MIKRSVNWRLWIGSILTICLILIAIFGTQLAPYPVDHAEKVVYVVTKNGGKIMAPPLPPSPSHWFGTDKWGYDMLTLLLYGAKYTIFTTLFVASLRVIIGGATGLWFGIRKNKVKVRPKSLMGLLGSIPAFIIVYFIMLGININSSLPSWSLTLLQSVVMALVGIHAIHNVIQKKTNEVSKELFVTAATSLGGSKLHIIRKHIISNIKDDFLILFINETIMVLNLIGQLGIFNLFLGGTIMHRWPTLYVSRTHEWAGLIGQERWIIFYSNQWVLLFPLGAFILTIFSFYLISRGLEDHQRMTHRKLPYI